MDMYGLFTYSTQMQEIYHTLIVWVSVGMFEHEWPEWLWMIKDLLGSVLFNLKEKYWIEHETNI